MLLRITIFASLLISAFALTDEELNNEQLSQTATAITIIFDSSGSMAGENKMNEAKTAFSAWLKGQSEDTRFSLIHFENRGTLAVPLGDNTRDEVVQEVKKLSPKGKTPIVKSLKMAHSNIKERRKSFSPYERHIVVVFTDGGESFDKQGNNGVVREIKTLLNDDIEVTGIGFHGQGNYMSAAATQYFDAKDTEELKQSLNKVTAEIDPNVEVELTEDEKKLLMEMDFSKPLSQSSFPEEHSEDPQMAGSFIKTVIGVGIAAVLIKKLSK